MNKLNSQTNKKFGLVKIKTSSDERGFLSKFQFDNHFFFTPKEFFLVYGVPDGQVRGQHAHHQCHQMLISASGSINVDVDDGSQKEMFTLNSQDFALYLPPYTWASQHQFSKDAVLLVFCSEYYDTADYIRDYDSFKKITSFKDLRN